MFVIDTGGAPPEPLPIQDLVPDWFRDMHPASTPERMAHDYAYHIIGAMDNPKTWPTVRRHVLHDWSFLRRLADIHPEVFDEVLCAYGERWQSLA